MESNKVFQGVDYGNIVKYELITEYPGSPELGCIINVVQNNPTGKAMGRLINFNLPKNNKFDNYPNIWKKLN